MDNYNSIWVIEDTLIAHYLTQDTNRAPDPNKIENEDPFKFILATIDNLKSNLPHLFVVAITENVEKSIALLKQIKTITPYYKVDVQVISSILNSDHIHFLRNNLNIKRIVKDISVKQKVIDLILASKKVRSK